MDEVEQLLRACERTGVLDGPVPGLAAALEVEDEPAGVPAGTRVGPYYLPAFAGVGFSRNEFRWSPRIQRDDGLLRLVPGLGTRAVDRVSDDYPVLIAPGKPGLRVNTTAWEIERYAPRRIDVIFLPRATSSTSLSR